MNTKQSIKSFYKNAQLREVSKDVIKAFEIVVREDEKNKLIKGKVREYFDKENDILSLSWGKCECSLELLDGRLVFDFNKDGKIVGLELFDFRKELEKSIEKNNKLFKKMEKKKK